MEPLNKAILVVDDEDALRTLVCILLRMAGYAILEAREGEEALEIVRQKGRSIALLLTDVNMPKLSGPELADKVSRIRPSLPVLFISADPPSASRSFECLAKPFTSQELIRRIEEALSRPTKEEK